MALPRFSKLDPAKRASIISVATEEFARQGYRKASLNRIIARCGMSRGALYYYFADKDDLYETVLDEFSTALLDFWSGGKGKYAVAFSRAKTPEAYWEEWVTHYRRSIRYYLQNPVVAELLWTTVRDLASGTSHPALNTVVNRAREWVREALSYGEQIGAVRTDLPEGVLLDTAFGMLEGFARWLERGWSESSEDQIDEHARLASGFLRRISEPLPASHAGGTRR